MIRKTLLVAITAAASYVVGCSSTPSQSMDSSGVTRTATTVTHLHLSPDGTRTIKVDTIPESVSSLSPESITVGSPPCTAQEDEFHDNSCCPNCLFDILCLSGTGTLDLSTVPLNSGTWAGAIHAYISQAEDGYFSFSSDGLTRCAAFGVTTTCTNEADAPSNINYVTLGATCPIKNCGPSDFLCSETCDGYLKQVCFPDSNCPTGCNRNLYCFQHMTCP